MCEKSLTIKAVKTLLIYRVDKLSCIFILYRLQFCLNEICKALTPQKISRDKIKAVTHNSRKNSNKRLMKTLKYNFASVQIIADHFNWNFKGLLILLMLFEWIKFTFTFVNFCWMGELNMFSLEENCWGNLQSCKPKPLKLVQNPLEENGEQKM